jgi:hypothetical protein
MPYLQQFPREALRLMVEWIVAEKVDNTGIVVDLRNASAIFPIGNAIFRNT